MPVEMRIHESTDVARDNHPYRVEWRGRQDKPNATFSNWQPVLVFGVVVLEIHLAESILKALYPATTGGDPGRWDCYLSFTTIYGQIIELRDAEGRAKVAENPGIEGH